MADYGLGAPSFAAFNTPTGPRVYRNGEPMDVRWVEENWLLVWFVGAKGWTNWDSPWVIYLQHRPSAIRLDEGGLHFEFKGPAGDVVLLPLYGYEKAPLPGKFGVPASGGPGAAKTGTPNDLPSHKIRTWEWARGIPREPLMRVKYWACATREFPIYCEDSFSVDRARDSMTIRQHFQWHSIQDDWKTRHIKVAPLSPPLALATMDKQFPVEFSRPVMDFALFTPYGPYMGVENRDSFDATFKVLQYVKETEAYDPAQTTNHPSVSAALERLRQIARESFPPKPESSAGGMENLSSGLMEDWWWAKALPYLDQVTRSNVVAALGRHFHERMAFAPAGQFHASLLETLWGYAHFTGDWTLIKDRWQTVRQSFSSLTQARWVGFGRDGISELADEAGPCLAMARMAYKVGDMDTYNYACYLFARELTVQYCQEEGAKYFRLHQPWHSMEFMDEEVYLTRLQGELAAWQIDGPKYPAAEVDRQYANRWLRFRNEDVGRFYRDYLAEDVRAQLDILKQRWDKNHKWQNEPDGMPSEVELRSLLLNETPAQLSVLANPSQFSGPPSGIIASCIAVLRTSHPTRYERLIPGGPASPFVAGLERDVAGPNPYLAQAVQSKGEEKTDANSQADWPEVTWWKSWKTPTGHRWTFGHVTPEEGQPTKARRIPLNWNTEVLSYE
jgi:hypothetical protein